MMSEQGVIQPPAALGSLVCSAVCQTIWQEQNPLSKLLLALARETLLAYQSQVNTKMLNPIFLCTFENVHIWTELNIPQTLIECDQKKKVGCY